MVERSRDGNKHHSDASEKSTGPLNAKGVKHLGSEQRKSGTSQGTKECIGSNSGSCKHEVSVNDVVERLEEDGQKAESGKNAGKSWRNPWNLLLVPGPGEDEETAGENGTTKDHGWKTPFWNSNAVVGLELADVGWLGQDDVCSG